MYLSRSRNPILRLIGNGIILAIFAVLFVLGLIFFSYLLIIGGIVGLAIIVAAYIRSKFFGYKQNDAAINKHHLNGRTIDQEQDNEPH